MNHGTDNEAQQNVREYEGIVIPRRLITMTYIAPFKIACEGWREMCHSLVSFFIQNQKKSTRVEIKTTLIFTINKIDSKGTDKLALPVIDFKLY